MIQLKHCKDQFCGFVVEFVQTLLGPGDELEACVLSLSGSILHETGNQQISLVLLHCLDAASYPDVSPFALINRKKCEAPEEEAGLDAWLISQNLHQINAISKEAERIVGL